MPNLMKASQKTTLKTQLTFFLVLSGIIEWVLQTRNTDFFFSKP